MSRLVLSAYVGVGVCGCECVGVCVYVSEIVQAVCMEGGKGTN